MSNTSWSSLFCSALLGLVVVFLDRQTAATLEGSSMGDPGRPFSQEPEEFTHIIRVSGVKASEESHAVASRQKRNIFFQSGLRLCGEETSDQVVSHHLSYFHLRVCQETIWEAFKIFWDRVPEQEEYQRWMNQCQEDAVTARDISSYFSQSEEHQALVKWRISHSGSKSEPARSWQHMCSTPTPASPEVLDAPELEDTKKEDAVPSSLEENPSNEITVQPSSTTVLEQVVELSILLIGEVFSDDLNDPASLKFQTLSRHLAEKIENALEGLPGFKSVSVIDFRPQKDTQGLEGIVVYYAVTVGVDGAGVSLEQLNYLTLQSNRVENSYREIQERPTTVYSISEVKNVFTVSWVSESVSAADEVTGGAADELPEVMTLDERDDDTLSGPSETNTVAAADREVVVLEESAVVSPAVVFNTNGPEAGSIEEEGLLLEEAVQAPETTSSKELPPELLSHELPKSSTLPEPPVESEASGSGPDHLDNPNEPSTSNLEDEEVSLEENKVDKSEAEKPTKPTKAPLKEEHLEISTFSTETTEEQGPPALLPSTEKEVLGSESEADSAEMALLPDGDDLVVGTPEESNVEVNLKEPEDVTFGGLLTHPEEPAFEENGFEGAIESEGIEVKGTSSEVVVIQEEAPLTPEILTEDLVEDEILVVNKEDPDTSVSGSPSSPRPTSLSAEMESPFTIISDIITDPKGQPDAAITLLVEIPTIHEGFDDATPGDQDYGVVSFNLTNQEGSTGSPFSVVDDTDQASIAMPVSPRRALMVFFSLRVTNMVFSEDLFNKSSPEYKALEQRFIELLVPYLQSNLSHFENLEILNFRNGSIVVNSRMRFGRPVARGVTTTVYLILEDFCNTAYQTMNLAIDKYSLDVESGDQADPCKFQACNEYAECKVNKWSGEAECVCNAGYFSVDGLPCQSICELRTDFCLNDGKCDIIPGQGAICRCRVGENWWYRGEHCEEYVSEPLVVGIAIASVAGFLLVASGVLFFLARTLRDQYDKDEAEDPIRRIESLQSIDRATKYNPMYESEGTTGYSHYYRRYPEPPVYSSASAEASTDFSSEEIRHIYENSELTKEEIQDRIRIIELYAKDRQFADFVRQHQAVMETRRESSSVQT
ncbi:interphotoreceptor matrix proteoglycan 2 isoform X2 [Kryptolebias marmoratus]|uniref:interphotoreceptor matrix proteoglycan 2 isoform X2 n=1 Tax=Kryptolebias marmoratus TaxID=37003 RepID=UPI0007F923EA|nr:interphotoreceptor matrix proteoglycan 2 isoform X2 [Kryptolebias marmoratus]